MGVKKQMKYSSALGIGKIFLFACLFFPQLSFAANEGDMYVSSSSSGGTGNNTWTGAANSTVTVYVFADNLSSIGAVSFTLTWDPTVLTYSSVTNGSVNGTWSQFPTASSGTLSFASSNSGAPISGSTLQIAVVTFTVNASPGSSSALTLSSLSVADTSFNSYTSTAANSGTFTLAGLVNGACGSADNKTYAYGTTSYGSDTFCSAGTASPTTPSFPTAGNTTTWACDGSGSNASCQASQQAGTAPTITSQPSNQTVNAGSSVTFTVSATGVPTPSTFQWEVSTDSGVTFNPISLATSSSYTINSVSGSENGYEYECVVSNGISPNATSSAATLTVLPVNGVCGSANNVYPYGTTSFGSDTLCTAGTANPSSVTFPAAGQSVTWVCEGIDSETNANCTATQNAKLLNRFR